MSMENDRASRVMTDGEVNNVVDELRYEDPKTDEEMKTYIEEIIAIITTGDEKAD